MVKSFIFHSRTFSLIFRICDNLGIKLCLHIHQYFPHLSVRLIDLALLCGVINDENETLEGIPDELLITFIIDLELSMKSSFKTFQFEGQPDQAKEDEHFIFSTELVFMKPVYGYHDKTECFVRFNFYSNWMAESAKVVLQKGFMNFRPILVYNHLEFLLQFYVDNQIYLNSLYLDQITVRKKRKDDDSPTDGEEEQYCSIGLSPVEEERLRTLPINYEYNSLRSTSSCFLECDAKVENIIQIVRKRDYPKDMFFKPSLPGIINLWNDHYARAIQRGQDFRDVVAFLDNKVQRKHEIRDPINQFFKSVLKTFIKAGSKDKDYQAFTETHTPSSSCKRSENDAIIQDLEDEMFDDSWGYEGDDMALTQEQLDLKEDYQFLKGDADYQNDNEEEEDDDGQGNRTLFDFDIGDEPEIDENFNPLEDVDDEPRIPQLDGNFDDSSGSESEVCKSPGSEDRSLNDNDSVRSFDFEDFDTPGTPDFNVNTGQHSTPVQIRRRNSQSSSEKRRPRSSLKRFRDNFNFETIEEDNVSTKFQRNNLGKRQKLSQLFKSTQQTGDLTERGFDFDMDSIISNTSTNNSYDGMTIEIGDLGEELWKQRFQLTIMSMELHCKTREDLLPDPARDPIRFVIFSVSNEVINESQSSFQLDVNSGETESLKFAYLGAIVVDSRKKLGKEVVRIGDKKINISYVKDEDQLLRTFSLYVEKFDPEVLTGYITDTSSWGYLFERCTILHYSEMLNNYSRIFNKYQAKNFSGGINKQPKLTGRVILNVWYLMRKEVTLRCYTFENVCENLLRERVHKMSNRMLNELWNKSRRHRDEKSRDRVLEYYLVRVINQVKMLVQTHLVRRTFDLSCLFGMKFEDALTRGTQYRVESMLLPLAKLENFIPVRFTRKTVDEQNAAEEIPLVMEPQIAMHTDPVAVLDFQSLYPSIMIAHNYCFTTCLGKVKNIVRGTGTLGCHKLVTDPETWDKIKDHLEIAPNGSVFVKANVRKGLLSK